jgi:nucleotide-binding universal stress UspA family protein
LEAVVIDQILAPLDGSALAECVLPHIISIAAVTHAKITLIQVLENPVGGKDTSPPIDPVKWQMQKQESQAYLENIAKKLQDSGLEATYAILEGNPAESIINFAHKNKMDLIALSTHGHTGLSSWNVSSVVQKVLSRSFRSILLVPAYRLDPASEIQYRRLFICSDSSARADYILPTAIGLAQFHKSQLVFGTVIQKPQIIQRLPLSAEAVKLINQLNDMNLEAAHHYYDEIVPQLSLKGLDVKINVEASDHIRSALHEMVEDANPDLILMVAHGNSGERYWPYGSVAKSLIDHGRVPLLVLQDLAENEIDATHAEKAFRETKGH